jgi:flavin reductase (DIM6/NTAB) family NADH-FMN oxidoreductase RutF
VSVHVRARLHAVIEAAGAFGVSILPELLEYEARRFAGLPVDPREHPPEFSWCDGVPVLAGALGWLTAEVAERHTVGDHTLFIGLVLDCGHSAADVAPLGYFRSAFARVVAADTSDAEAIDPWGADAADRWG